MQIFEVIVEAAERVLMSSTAPSANIVLLGIAAKIDKWQNC
jgi:hypothetical protein